MHTPISLSIDTPLDEWLSYLEKAHPRNIDLGLNRIANMAKKLGLTHIAPFVITVGGTNGKGTTCRLLELILLNSGLKVGVYSSPHLLHYRERIRINDHYLNDKLHCQAFDLIEKHKTHSLSYFEFSTLSAFYLFKQAQLDVVILEVGLGGRLDATNIIDSNVAVITSIDIDHTAFLGKTRDAISFEKAGIFRSMCPAVIGEVQIPHQMREYAHSLGCQLYAVGENWQYEEKSTYWHWVSDSQTYHYLPKPAIPIANAGTALAVLPFLPFTIPIKAIYSALKCVKLAGRFQTLSVEQQKILAQKYQCKITDLPRIILDVGHNPHASRYLANKLQAIKTCSTPRFLGRVFALCGVLKDKDLVGILTPMQAVIDEWYCLSLAGDRGQSGKYIANALQNFNPRQNEIPYYPTISCALKQILPKLKKEDILLVFGSFHTVAEFLSFLQTSSSPMP